jgi:hypothetical protein
MVVQRRVQAPAAPAPQTQLQTREFQTRVFDTNDTKLIMKALLNVLQDDGFIVKNAVMDLGLLSATKEIDMNNQPKSSGGGSGDFWGELFNAMAKNKKNTKTEETTFMKLKIVEVSVNISEFGLRSKVRANFQAKILDNKGNTVEVQTVDDPKFYQDFFMKVDKGIFIQKQGF